MQVFSFLFFGLLKKTFSKSPKSHFSKGVNPCSWSKNAIFFYFLFSIKMRLEIRFNDVLDTKETFFGYENNTFSTTQKWHFSKGVNPCFWWKNTIFFIFFSVKIRLEIRFHNVLERKRKLFLTIKSKFLKVPKIILF